MPARAKSQTEKKANDVRRVQRWREKKKKEKEAVDIGRDTEATRPAPAAPHQSETDDISRTITTSPLNITAVHPVPSSSGAIRDPEPSAVNPINENHENTDILGDSNVTTASLPLPLSLPTTITQPTIEPPEELDDTIQSLEQLNLTTGSLGREIYSKHTPSADTPSHQKVYDLRSTSRLPYQGIPNTYTHTSSTALSTHTAKSVESPYRYSERRSHISHEQDLRANLHRTLPKPQQIQEPSLPTPHTQSIDGSSQLQYMLPADHHTISTTSGSQISHHMAIPSTEIESAYILSETASTSDTLQEPTISHTNQFDDDDDDDDNNNNNDNDDDNNSDDRVKYNSPLISLADQIIGEKAIISTKDRVTHISDDSNNTSVNSLNNNNLQPSPVITNDDTGLIEAEVTLHAGWASFCDCATKSNSTSDDQYSLTELTEYWNNFLPPPDGSTSHNLRTPLGRHTILPRDNSYNDYTDINWQSLLAGPHGPTGPPRLDFAKSESVFQERTRTSTSKIQRLWDVDSFLARITTLAAHKSGFLLAYNPPFLRRITQSPRVKFGGRSPDKIKQLRLGYGVGDGGSGYSTHVLFPNLPVNDTTHLTESQRAMWIDDIVYPALKASCSNSVLQHHPRGFRDALRKSAVKTEINTARSGQPIDVIYPVPASALARFWSEILRRANEHALFREPILMVSGHDLKVHMQRETAAEARAAFLNHLDNCYDMREEIMPAQEAWLDLGAEDVPIDLDLADGITLLRKSPCLEHWQSHFHDPRARGSRVKVSRFPFMLTRDAGTMSVKLNEGNWLRDKGGLAYHKSYNLNKDMFACPIKEHGPFSNVYLEALGLSESHMEQWFTANRRGEAVDTDEENPSTSALHAKAQLIKAYEASKTRVAEALLSAKRERMNFGARQEYRISLLLFRRLNLDMDTTIHSLWWTPPTSPPQERPQSITSSTIPDSPHTSTHSLPSRDCNDAGQDPLQSRKCKDTKSDIQPLLNSAFSIKPENDPADVAIPERATPLTGSVTHPSAHRCFWILPTQEVNDFIAASANRWMLCLEALASRSVKGAGGLAVAPEHEQVLNGVMISAMVQTLQLSFSGMEPTARRALWLTSWRPRHKAPDDGLAVDSSADEDRSDADDPAIEEVFGLQYRDALQEYGTVWLPSDIIMWEGLPLFTRAILPQLALAQQDNAFQRIFHATTDIQDKLTRTSMRARWFRQYTKEARGDWSGTDEETPPPGMMTPVFSLGAELAIQMYIQKVFSIILARAVEGTSDRAEKQRIKQRYTARLTDDELLGLEGLNHALVARLLGDESPLVVFGRGGRANAYFKSHATGQWISRVRELFTWNDHPGRKMRGWENEPYRQFARQMYRIVAQEINILTAEQFLNELAIVAHRRLLTILQYDYDKLSVMRKAFSHHSEYTREKIQEQTMIERTQWLVAQVPPDSINDYRAAKKTGHNHNVHAVRQSISKHGLLVSGATSHIYKEAGLIDDPKYIGWNTRMARAKAFHYEFETALKDMKLEGDSEEVD